MYVRDNIGHGNVIRVPAEGYLEIWVKNGSSIEYAGKIQGGSGAKIMRAAVNSIGISEKQAAKLSNAVRVAKRQRRYANQDEAIRNFTKTLPKSISWLYQTVMEGIDALSVAYKLEIIDGLAQEGVDEIKEHNWLPILNWFKEKVIDSEQLKDVSERKTFYSLRQAFVRAASRMVHDDVRNASTMKLAMDEGKRDDDYWSRYAEVKK